MFGNISIPRKDSITHGVLVPRSLWPIWQVFITMVHNLFSVFIVYNKAVDKNLNWCFLAHVLFQTFYSHDFLWFTLYKACNCGAVGILPKEMDLFWGKASSPCGQRWEVGKWIIIFCKQHIEFLGSIELTLSVFWWASDTSKGTK